MTSVEPSEIEDVNEVEDSGKKLDMSDINQTAMVSFGTYGADIDLSNLALVTSGIGWELVDDIIQFDSLAADNSYNIIGNNSINNNGIDINVDEGKNVSINLNNVNLDTTASGAPSAPAFKVTSGLLTINLIGTNTLKSVNNYTGLQITGSEDKTELIISAQSPRDSLEATGGANGAGIGGGSDGSGSEINIEGGEIEATGGRIRRRYWRRL